MVCPHQREKPVLAIQFVGKSSLLSGAKSEYLQVQCITHPNGDGKSEEQKKGATAKQCLETLHGKGQEVTSQYKGGCRNPMKDGWQVCRIPKRHSPAE